MNTHNYRIRNFLANEDGPTAVEYAIMLALILAACITAVATFGQSLSASFSLSGTTVGS
jgi:pilus assembly protein Flp/PilA